MSPPTWLSSCCADAETTEVAVDDVDDDAKASKARDLVVDFMVCVVVLLSDLVVLRRRS
jgi:hypothetical protein